MNIIVGATGRIRSQRCSTKMWLFNIPQAEWKKTLLSFGFTDNAPTNLSDMTQAVIDNKTIPERPNNTVKLPTTLEAYLKEQLKR